MDYRDKIFEMLGVKPKEFFSVRGENSTYYYINDDLKIYNDVNLPSMSLDISDILNGRVKINKIIKYTKEEQIAIDYAKICGCEWLAADCNGLIYGYRIEKPKKGKTLWSNDYDSIPLLVPFSFIHWEDEEPYYIGE